MYEGWSDFYKAIYDAQGFVHYEKLKRYLDGVTMESMDSAMVELNFLGTFLGYTLMWSDASASSRNTNLFIKAAAAGKALARYIESAFIASHELSSQVYY